MATTTSHRKDCAQFSNDGTDRLPPHSIEAEQGVLGCCLLSPDCIADCRAKNLTVLDFYDLRNQVIFQTLLLLESRLDAWEIDILVFQESLKKRNLMEDAGGLVYLNGLPDASPSALNIDQYLQIVLEKSKLRNIIRFCTDIVGRAYEFTGEVEELAEQISREIVAVCEPKETTQKTKTWEQLLKFDTDHDETCVVGFKNGKTTRFLCRGYPAWLIGPSGAGKSSLHMTMAAHFACGNDFCSMSVNGKPLRVLVAQAENDDGDMAEMAQGINETLMIDFDDEVSSKLISKNLKVISDVRKIGVEFCTWLKREILLHKADIVFVDPLLSFAGIEISRQSEVSMFCRVWMGPVLQSTGCVMIAVHHTGKPKTDQKRSNSSYDLMYEGIGSSELVNWARAVMLLQPEVGKPGAFRLHLAKRGKRSGATHPSGQPTEVIFIRHALKGIHWEQIDPPEENEAEKSDNKPAHRPSQREQVAAMNLFTFCAACKSDGESKNSISKRLENWLAKESRPKMDVKISTCKKIIGLLIENGKLAKGDDGLYRKGGQA